MAIAQIKFNPDQLTQEFSKLQKAIASPELVSKFKETAREFEALQKPLVGKLEGELQNGLQSLSAIAKDFPVPEITAKLDIQLKNATTLANNLQHQMPELQKAMGRLNGAMATVGDKLKPALTSEIKTKLANITGSQLEPAFNNMVAALPTAAAMAASLDQAANLLSERVGDINIQLKSEEIQADLEKAVEGFDAALKLNLPKLANFKLPDISVEITGNISQLSGQLTKNLEGALEAFTALPVLDTLHQMNGSLDKVIQNLNLPKDIIGGAAARDVLNLLSKNATKDAIDLITNNANLNVKLSIPEIETAMNELQSKLGTVGVLLTPPVDLSGIVSTNPIYKLSTLLGNFSIVNNFDEIAAELLTVTRELETAVIHWSETEADVYIGAEEIQKAAGSVEYHYIIRKDGTIQRGKAAQQVADHAGSYNDKSISILIVGGLKGFKGEEALEFAKESIGVNQIMALKKLLGKVYDILPGIQIYGHGQIDESVSSKEPGIAVDDFIDKVFNKTNEKPPEIQLPPNPELSGQPTGMGDVKYADNFSAKIRGRAVHPQMMEILELVSANLGCKFVIISGGQMPRLEIVRKGGYQSGKTWYVGKTAVAFGSPRHDGGWAADVSVFDKNGKFINFGTATPSQEALTIARALAQKVTGFGAGPGTNGGRSYMGGAIHVDISQGRVFNANGSPAGYGGHWGVDWTSATSPQWLRQIMGG